MTNPIDIGNGYKGPPVVFMCEIFDPIAIYSTVCITGDHLHKYCDGWSKAGDECECPCHPKEDKTKEPADVDL